MSPSLHKPSSSSLPLPLSSPPDNNDNDNNNKNNKNNKLSALFTSGNWKQWNCTRTHILRSALVASLVTAAVACAVLSYMVLSDTERDVGVYAYESIAASALVNARSVTKRKIQGSEVMASFLSYEIPNADQWPFIEVDGYIPIASKVAALSSSNTQSLMVFVQPDQAQEFEAHTQQVYRDQGRPEDAGALADFGFGIWKNDLDTGKRVHDISGETTWGGDRRILAPLMMHNQPGAGSLMYNVYSEADRGIQLDAMFDCVRDHQDPSTSPPCAAITDMLELKLKPGPAGLLFQPIFPVNDPNEFVGFATTSIHWQDVLENIVPDYVDGLVCVVSTKTASYTYEIRSGVPQLVGPGDLHNGFDKYGQSVVLNDFIETETETSAVYTLTIYPTKELLDTFSTNSPWAVSLGFLGVILICTCLFFVYDYLVQAEATKRKEILDMKRRYVRFISHEMRTPLNTVCMGLELLASEIKPSDQSASTDLEKDRQNSDLAFWHSVVTDARENSDIAVSILNDLLDYDKLETGALKVETDRVDIWELVRRTASQFNIQAVNRKILLLVDLRNPCGNSTPLSSVKADEDNVDVEQCRLHQCQAFGDEMKLSQVFRNLLSNALKFTPEGGSITISAEYDPHGLSNTKVPLFDSDKGAEHPRAGSIKITVADTGVGLSPDQLSQLFAEGIQFDPNRLQHGGGSGLGLNIAKGIVEQHGGRVVATSDGIGKGTTFVVELPLFTFKDCEVSKRKRSRSIDARFLKTGSMTASETELTYAEENEDHMRRILVVEDSESSRKMLIRLLERNGHVCDPACDGEEAVALARAHPDAWDVILMDFEMPRLKGPETTRQIRQLGFTGLILGVTGNVLAEDVGLFLDNGADQVLSKPISMDALRSCWDQKRVPGLR
jgi:signal transduction histidine kinase/CheY-like chemotaxis protein